MSPTTPPRAWTQGATPIRSFPDPHIDLFEQVPTVMLPNPKSDLQSGLVCDRPTFVHFVYVVLVWPKLLAHLGQGPTDHVALHQLRPTDPVPGLVR